MEALVAVAVLAIFGYTVGSIKVINQGNEGIVERLGRYQRTLKPGLNVVVPFLDTVLVETTREQQLDVAPQTATTSDNVTIKVDAVLFWRILDVEKAYYNVEDLEEALKNIVLGSLRSAVGHMSLSETFSNRDQINKTLLKELDSATEPWGVKVTRVEIQEVEVPENVRQALELERAAESKRRAEVAEAKATVESIERIAAALKADPNAEAVIRYLLTQRYVDANYKLSESNNSKIIFMDPKALSETIGELIGADSTEGFGNSGSSS
jgi:regulator of protease activity HflC (stomatin/prohibitin superfamily)